MKVDNKLIHHLSRLARLSFDKEGIEEIKSDLVDMLQFVNKLSEIETKDVEPLIFLNSEVNMLRFDQIDESITQKEALKNAPDKDSDYFKVPTVLRK